MLRLLAPVFLMLACALPAEAHKLRLFATVEGDAVTGYAFFVGGGRAAGSGWAAKDAEGAQIAAGTTDADGRYRFTPPAPVTGDITVTVDTQEGHIAMAVVRPERFDGPATTAPPPAPAAIAPSRAPAPNEAEIAALIGRAVQREVAPLLERIEEMDARMRITDMLSGLFLIIGLAGIGLYVRGRR